jgi:cytochrome c553
MKILTSTLFVALALSASVATAQAPTAAATKGDAKAGRQKAVAICSGCHGVPGTKTAFPEVYHVPRIGNQNEAYLVAALKAYKAGERYNPTMKALASALTDKEIMDIAAYYASADVGRVMK